MGLIIIGGIFFIIGLIYRPEWVAVLLFTLTISIFNVEMVQLPINLKAIISIALFLRILFGNKDNLKYPSFLSSGSVKLFFLFWIYVLIISSDQGLFTIDLVKRVTSLLLLAYFAYHFLYVKGNSNVLRAALILSGLICFADLVYTYKEFGSFPVQRVFLALTGQVQEVDPDDMYESQTNHNFYGQITGMAFVFILNDLIKNKSSPRYMMLLLPFMFIGVLMSTSRSALLALIIMTIVIIFSGLRKVEYRKKVYKIGSFALAAIAVGILLFSTIGMYFKLDNKFADEVVLRLTEEPIAIVQKTLGYNYDVQNLGSMDWREEASTDALAVYSKLKFAEQMKGIGHGGFMERNLGNGLNPHNGILLILIETGLVGLTIYCLLMGSVLIKAIKTKVFSPSFAVIGFILIYGIGQNEEIASIVMFLFVATLIAETRFQSAEQSRKNNLVKLPA
jgi:hypothetical protein